MVQIFLKLQLLCKYFAGMARASPNEARSMSKVCVQLD